MFAFVSTLASPPMSCPNYQFTIPGSSLVRVSPYELDNSCMPPLAGSTLRSSGGEVAGGQVSETRVMVARTRRRGREGVNRRALLKEAPRPRLRRTPRLRDFSSHNKPRLTSTTSEASNCSEVR